MDLLVGQCRYLKAFTIPKMKLREKLSMRDFSVELETVAADVDDIVIPPGTSAPFKQVPLLPTEETVLASALQELLSHGDPMKYAFHFTYFWGKSKQFPAIKLWSMVPNKTQGEFAEAFLKVAAKFVEPLRAGMISAEQEIEIERQILIEEQLQKNKPHANETPQESDDDQKYVTDEEAVFQGEPEEEPPTDFSFDPYTLPDDIKEEEI